MENSCVVCGCYIPEGDHVCTACRKNGPDIAVKKSTDNMIFSGSTNPSVITIDTGVSKVDFMIYSTADLIVNFAKYYVFQQNFTNLGTLSYPFIKQNMKPCDRGDMNNAQERLMEEYRKTVEVIESIIKK